MIQPEIIKIAKSTKSDFIELNPNYMCGTDKLLYIFNMVFIGSDEYYIGSTPELEGKSEPAWAVWRPERVLNEIHKKRDICMRVSEQTPLHVVEDLLENSQYNTVRNSKASDGTKLVNIAANYMMYMYPGLNPMNKNDTLVVDIFPFDNVSFMARFRIGKKKYEIHQYIRCRYLC